MIKIGITGGIGSGKTVVCKIFATLGIPIYYADSEAKKITNTNKTIRARLISNFGKDIYLPSGKLNKPKLSGIIFKNKQALQKVNSIIHPIVREHYHKWLLEHQKEPFTIKEAAILFETGTYKELDKIITVICPKEIRMKRIQDRDNISKEEIIRKINNQLSDDERIQRSDYIIYNDEKQLLIPQVLNNYELIINN